jgi:RNA polymerase sigma-70 factor (ECF subfamily)
MVLNQDRERARYALLSLTPDQRQVIMLKFLEGWQNPEIARALNKPVGAVKSLQHRGLAALRRILIPDGTESDHA